MTEINSLLFFIMGQHQRKYSPSLFGFFLKMEEAENLDFSRNFRLPGYVPSAIRTRGLSLRRSPRGAFLTPYKSPKILDFTGFSGISLLVNSRPKPANFSWFFAFLLAGY